MSIATRLSFPLIDRKASTESTFANEATTSSARHDGHPVFEFYGRKTAISLTFVSSIWNMVRASRGDDHAARFSYVIGATLA
jgi:hypothetical protein